MAGRFSFRETAVTTTLQGLSADQRRTFEDRGLVRLHGLVPRRTAETLADVLWRELARGYGVQRRDRRTWRSERPSDFKPLRTADALKAMATPAFRSLIDDLLGQGHWVEPNYWGQPLVCFPGQHRWDVPHQNWHLDLPDHPQRLRLPIGRLFLILAPLKPRGGGTLVAAGSHRLVEALAHQTNAALSSSAIRLRLKAEHRWFGELMSETPRFDRARRFMAQPTEVAGVPMRVEEMTGEPGDVFVMHPAALHTLSPNVRDEPRLALAQSIFPKAYFADAARP